MGFAGEADDAGKRDVGVTDAVAEPIGRRHPGALGLQQLQDVGYLRRAALDPQRELLVLPKHALVEQADRLVAEPHRERTDTQMTPPLDAAARQHRLRLAGE